MEVKEANSGCNSKILSRSKQEPYPKLWYVCKYCKTAFDRPVLLVAHKKQLHLPQFIQDKRNRELETRRIESKAAQEAPIQIKNKSNKTDFIATTAEDVEQPRTEESSDINSIKEAIEFTYLCSDCGSLLRTQLLVDEHEKNRHCGPRVEV